MIKFSSIIHFYIFTAICGAAISFSSLYLFHLAMGLMFLSLIVIATKKPLPIKVQSTKLHYFFVFMFIYYTFTLLWSISPSSTALYIFYITCGGVLALSIVYYGDNEKTLSNIFKISCVAFSLEIFLSLLEVYTPFRLPVSPFSSYLHLFGRASSDTYILAGLANSEGVPTGFQWNPNNLSTTMAIIFPFFLFHKNARIKWLGVVAVIIIINASGSRANLLAILLMFLLSLLFYKKIKFLIGITIILPFYYFIPIITNYFYNSSFGIGVKYSVVAFANTLTGENEKGDSIDVRRTLINQGLESLKDTYGIGIGGGASKTIHSGFGESASMHNFWIEILVEGGVLFFFLFVIWYATITFRLFRISYRAKNETLGYYASSSCLAMIGFIPAAISASSTIYLLPMWLMFGFAIAVINVYYKKVKSQKCVDMDSKVANI
ncbi:O-antigen ligase [Paenisporosarcina sp. OV554]|uniref:O-antigen ligase family protein n=1 Tax=Paenisporosarcina sp. OV554 TaxID=2135694 RepID=UPI0013048A07|nr:O-antigen ligase family protein [Paenisporosarcina sp. OV554]